MLAPEVQTSSSAVPIAATPFFHQPLLRFVEYEFVPWEEEESLVGGAPVAVFAAPPGTTPTLPCSLSCPRVLPPTQGGPTEAYYPYDPTVRTLPSVAECQPQLNGYGINGSNMGRIDRECKDHSMHHYSAIGTLSVPPAIRKRPLGDRALDKDYKVLKELSDTLAVVPGLEKVRWQSILQNTRGPEVGERETQRRVKEAELLGTRLFGGDVRKLLTSVLNAHLDFLVKYVSGTLSTSKRGHKKVRDQLYKVLLECKLKAEREQAEGKVVQEDEGADDEHDEEDLGEQNLSKEDLMQGEEETGMNHDLQSMNNIIKQESRTSTCG